MQGTRRELKLESSGTSEEDGGLVAFCTGMQVIMNDKGYWIQSFDDGVSWVFAVVMSMEKIKLVKDR